MRSTNKTALWWWVLTPSPTSTATSCLRAWLTTANGLLKTVATMLCASTASVPRALSTLRCPAVFEAVYLCRRWDDNSDAALDVEKMNRNNTYKDRIRTWELQARIAMNKAK